MTLIKPQWYEIPEKMENLPLDSVYLNGLVLDTNEYNKQDFQVEIKLEDLRKEDHLVGKFIDYPKFQKAVTQYVENYKN